MRQKRMDIYYTIFLGLIKEFTKQNPPSKRRVNLFKVQGSTFNADELKRVINFFKSLK